MREWRVFLFFLSNWDGAPLGVGALSKLRTLHIGSGGTGCLYTINISAVKMND